MNKRFDSTLGLARSLLVYYGQPWRRSALKFFYGQLICPGDLVFDIGAHVGSRTRTLLALDADVVAVEPQPLFADLIERRYGARLHGFERVAVGAEEGEVALAISSRHPTVSSISGNFVRTAGGTKGFSSVVWDKTVTVPMTTLDALIDRHGQPYFCKIDVEGAESAILEGLSRALSLVAFEYIPAMPEIAIAAVERLETLGDYRFNRVVGEKHRFVSTHWVSAGEILETIRGLSTDDPSGDIYARLVS
ncbi:FkbM family methyltransferase [Martelella mangrovi]|uniref:FkbM family methyltransferase n=1 Tax=Martelella mangrovi TaxID=1397477 RepID=A0ABV2I9V7_9HYPH